MVALGALHAARVSSLLRAKKKSFVEVVRGLLTTARAKAGAPLPESAWSDMLTQELGQDEAKRFADALAGKEIALDGTALGPCFRAEKGEYAAFELGFDAITTAESQAQKVVGLDPKGPAAKAGLEASDVLEDAIYAEGRADVPVKLVVTRSGAKKEITFKPAGERRAGPLFVRVRKER